MDLAEQVEDFIPVIQSRGDSEMDSLIMFIFILLILSLLLLWLGRFLYQKYKDRKIVATTANDLKTATGTSVPGGATGATGTPVMSSLIAQKSTSALSAASKSSGGGFSTLGGSRGRVCKTSYYLNMSFLSNILTFRNLVLHLNQNHNHRHH